MPKIKLLKSFLEGFRYWSCQIKCFSIIIKKGKLHSLILIAINKYKQMSVLLRNRYWFYRSLYDDYCGREVRLGFGLCAAIWLPAYWFS